MTRGLRMSVKGIEELIEDTNKDVCMYSVPSTLYCTSKSDSALEGNRGDPSSFLSSTNAYCS